MYVMRRTLVLLLVVAVVTGEENCLALDEDHAANNEIRIVRFTFKVKRLYISPEIFVNSRRTVIFPIQNIHTT